MFFLRIWLTEKNNSKIRDLISWKKRNKKNNNSEKIGPFGPDFLRFRGKKERKNVFFANTQNHGKKEVKKKIGRFAADYFFYFFFQNRSKKNTAANGN